MVKRNMGNKKGSTLEWVEDTFGKQKHKGEGSEKGEESSDKVEKITRERGDNK